MDRDPAGPSAPLERARPSAAARTLAAIEILLCSDYPTQLLLGAAFSALGYELQGPDGTLNIGFVVALSLADTLLLLGLIVMFLRAHGERPRDIFLGTRHVLTEARLGIPMTFMVFVLALAMLLTLQGIAPWLHTVERNPLRDLVRTPSDALFFAIVVVVAGGVREELQRAFLLYRFEHWLGGRAVGVLIASAVFGAGHLQQGTDAAIAVGILGAFWAVVYLRRRSVVAPVVSHSGFNLLQLAQLLVTGR